jgi:hypothetical protein
MQPYILYSHNPDIIQSMDHVKTMFSLPDLHGIVTHPLQYNIQNLHISIHRGLKPLDIKKYAPPRDANKHQNMNVRLNYVVDYFVDNMQITIILNVNTMVAINQQHIACNCIKKKHIAKNIIILNGR